MYGWKWTTKYASWVNHKYADQELNTVFQTPFSWWQLSLEPGYCQYLDSWFSFIRLKIFSNRSITSCFCFSLAIGPPPYKTSYLLVGCVEHKYLVVEVEFVLLQRPPNISKYFLYIYYIFTIYLLYINNNISIMLLK